MASWNPSTHTWESIAFYYEVIPDPSLLEWRPVRQANGKLHFSFGLEGIRLSVNGLQRLYPVVTNFRNETLIASMNHPESPMIPVCFNQTRQQWEPSLLVHYLTPGIADEDLIRSEAQSTAPGVRLKPNAQGIVVVGAQAYLMGEYGWYRLIWRAPEREWGVSTRTAGAEQWVRVTYQSEVDGWQAHSPSSSQPLQSGPLAYVGTGDRLESEVQDAMGMILYRGRERLPGSLRDKIDRAIEFAMQTASGAAQSLRAGLSVQDQLTLQQRLGMDAPLTPARLQELQTLFKAIAADLARYRPSGSHVQQIVIIAEKSGDVSFVSATDRHRRIFIGQKHLSLSTANLAHIFLHEDLHFLHENAQFHRAFDYFYHGSYVDTDARALSRSIDNIGQTAVNIGRGRQIPNLLTQHSQIRNEQITQLGSSTTRAELLAHNADTQAHLMIWLDRLKFIQRSSNSSGSDASRGNATANTHR
ncbi:hypothetical protein [Paraburkholderia aspalathi]|uniref:hypothetical protein n=1 Tax=Paraburkholderia aspalathi TaxID=1324617 RepID=UPI0038B9A095